MNTIPIYFASHMVSEVQSFSPSPTKPLFVMHSWLKSALPVEVLRPTPATVEQLSLAHDEAFVRAVLNGTRDNGFGNTSEQVAASLPWTVGAMLSAARHAWKHGGAAVAPCSGFHHACWSEAAGYCTFNGLMVTALTLLREGATRVGILDCDMHFGDGTEDIIEHLGVRDQVRHLTAGQTFRSANQVPAFFEWLKAGLEALASCDVVLYQAGADPHLDDPLGGWLTNDELRRRDAVVFEGLHARSVPVAWNLAGGYQQDADGGISKVLAIHDATLQECARVYVGA